MAGLSDLLGSNGPIEQLLLWGVVNQVISSLSQPALTALLQDVQQAHPEIALDAVTAAGAAERGIMTPGHAQAEAAKGGIDPARFDVLRQLHKFRLSPADLATAVLRDRVTAGQAEAEAKPQGVTAEQLAVLTYLAGDAPGPQQLAEALRRRLIPRDGSGQDSVSFAQGIRESRLHDKWADLIEQLSQVLLSPPEAASAVVRNFMPDAEARAVAERQGVDASTFATMVQLSADAPGPQQLAEALRRGLIGRDGTGPDSTSFAQGIAEGRLADKWAPVIQGLAQLWPTPTDALDAAVKGQLPPDVAKATYEQLGGAPQFYQWLLDSIGEGPTPLEAAEMAARGIIDWQGTGPDSTSFEQAVRESHYRNKWTDAYREISRYLPPPGEIVTFLAHGAITEARAAELLSKHDLAPDIAHAYLTEAQLTALSDYRGLTVSAVIDMYFARMVEHDQAVELLGLLHVTARAAELLLAYADMREVITQVQRSVQRIATLYTGRKISTDTALQALGGLGIPLAQADTLIQGWKLQAAANVKTLTQSEIVSAWYYGIFTLDDAVSELTAIGYTPFDAWALLSLKVKGPLPGQPVRDVATAPTQVIPGVT